MLVDEVIPNFSYVHKYLLRFYFILSEYFQIFISGTHRKCENLDYATKYSATYLLSFSGLAYFIFTNSGYFQHTTASF